MVDRPSRPGPPRPSAESGRLRRALRRLPAARRLATSGALTAYLLRAGESAAVLREVGRLREVSFRAHAMGAGRAHDLDAFDGWYEQVVVWDDATRAVAAGCRLAPVARVWRERGPAGLYTATLFRIGARFGAWAGPALEVGRWFIRPGRPDAAILLALLWRAIGTRVVAESGCHRLLGAVSISAAYRPASRALMARWLLGAKCRPAAGARVAACHPFRPGRAGVDAPPPRSLAALVRRVRELEPDGKGPPALLRHYLALRSKLCGLGSDPAFGGCLDALTLVDLASAPASALAGYLRGAELARVRRRGRSGLSRRSRGSASGSRRRGAG